MGILAILCRCIFKIQKIEMRLILVSIYSVIYKRILLHVTERFPSADDPSFYLVLKVPFFRNDKDPDLGTDL